MEKRMAQQWLLVGFVTLAIALFGVGCPKRTDVPPVSDEVTIEKPDTDEAEPEVEDVSESPVTEESLSGSQDRLGADISLMDIYFEFDRYNIKPDMRNILKANYVALQAKPDAEILVEGHCDERGTVEYNLALGQKRANSTRDYMISLGVKPSQVSTISYGEEMPLDPRHNDDAYAKNRRAHLLIIKK